MLNDKVGTASIRPYDDSPGYDLVSLGLVALVILLIGVWTTHFVRQPAPGYSEYRNVCARADLDTAAGHIQVAKWVDFHLRPAKGDRLPIEMGDHLKKAVALDRQTGQTEATTWARNWTRERAAWLAAKDAQVFNTAAHVELAELMDALGFKEEAAAEKARIRKYRPGYPLK